MIPSTRLRRACAAAALLIACAEPPAWAQSAAVAGRVVTREGGPLARATVALDGRGATMTARDGTFAIASVADGEHTLTISHIGFAPFTTSFTAAGGTPIRLEIVLDERPSGSGAVIVSAERDALRPSMSSTALKTTTPLIETPATVQLVTGERIAEQRVDRVGDVFDYMTGIVQGGGTRAQSYVMRGFAVDDRFIPYQVDGVSGGVWRQHEPPAALIERVEYLKGPSSTLYGITQLGGVLNYITKKPLATKQSLVEVRHSTFASELSPLGARNSASVTADATGPLDSGGTFLYRVIANHINTTSYRNDVEESSLDLHPSLTWNASQATQLTASLNVNVDKGDWDEFLPVPSRDLAKIPDIRTRINAPTDAYWDYGWGVGLLARHTLSEDWVLRSAARHTERIDGRQLFEFIGLKSDNETMRRNWRDQFNERYYTYADVTAEGRVATGSIEHTILTGVTLGSERIHFDRRNMQTDSTLDVNIYDPVHEAGVLLPEKPGVDRHSRNSYLGAYLQAQVELMPQVQIVAGAQYTGASIEHEERRSGLSFTKTNAGISPRAGLVVLPVEGVSLFGSFGTSFSPTNAERENAEGGIDFEPEIGRQIEAGVKVDLLASRLVGSIAGYQLDYTNALNATGQRNANGNTVYVQTGRSRSRGVELDLAAEPMRGVALTLGYAYTDARVTEDADTVLIGQRLSFVPYNSWNVWATLDLGAVADAVDGLKLGLGATSMDDRPTEFATATRPALVIPAYTRLDAFVSYAFTGATLALNVANLLDERYYANGGFARIVPGAPRSVRTSLQIHL